MAVAHVFVKCGLSTELWTRSRGVSSFYGMEGSGSRFGGTSAGRASTRFGRRVDRFARASRSALRVRLSRFGADFGRRASALSIILARTTMGSAEAFPGSACDGTRRASAEWTRYP